MADAADPLTAARRPTSHRRFLAVRWVRDVTLSACVLIAAAVAYDRFFVPTIRPPRVDVVPLKPVAALRRDDSLSDLFAEQDWRRRQPKRLRTRDMTLLFEHAKQTDATHWKFHPVTVVVGRGMSAGDAGDDAPIVMNAEQGVVIEFSGTLTDLGNTDRPPIRSGRLIGPVTIQRDDADRPMRMTASGVGFEPGRIWTPSPFTLSADGVTAAGRDLTLHLSRDRQPKPDRVELIYLDRLDVALPPDRGGGSVSVRCDGRVEYDFAASRLSLDGGFAVARTDGGGRVTDRLDGGQVTMDLRVDEPAAASTDDRPDQWLRRVTATGSPMTAAASSWDVSLRCERLHWDAAAGTLSATGRRGVELRRGGVTARLAGVDYRYDPAAPRRIGTVAVDGVGIVSADPGSDVPFREIRFTGGLRAGPQNNDATGDVTGDDPRIEVRLGGDLDATLADGGTAHADRLSATLIPTAGGYRPESLSADGSVRVDAAAVTVRTDTLRVFIADDPDARRPIGGEPVRDEPTRDRSFVRQPGDRPGGVGSTASATAHRPELVGGEINAELLFHPRRGYRPSRLRVDRDVAIRHTVTSGGQTLPLELTGGRLDYVAIPESSVTLIGDRGDARLAVRDGYLTAPTIRLRPDDNTVRIDDPGELQSPTGLIAPASGAIAWNRPPRCRWRGSMAFDGRSLVVDGGVDLDGSVLRDGQTIDATLRGDRLTATLQTPLDLRRMGRRPARLAAVDLTPPRDRPLTIDGTVRRTDGQPASRHLAHLSSLRLWPDDDGAWRTSAPGAGWYRGWFAESSSPTASLRSDPDMLTSDDATHHGTQLRFTGGIDGDLTRRQFVINDDVRIGRVPIASLDAPIELGRVTHPPAGGTLLDCRTLRVGVDPSRAGDRMPAWEVVADGGVTFQTLGEKGWIGVTAATANYLAAADRFTVRGGPRTPASFRQVQPDGTPGASGRVKVLSIRPRTMTVEHLVFESFNLAARPEP